MLFPSQCSVNSGSKLPTNIRPLYNPPQLAEHPIEHTHDWELREDWIRLRARFLMFFLARLSRFKFGALSRIYDLPTTLLNWPSIQLNIHTAENCAKTELDWKWDIHCSADSSSELFHEHTTFPQETIFPQPFLN